MKGLGAGKYKRTKEIRKKLSDTKKGHPNLKARGRIAKNRMDLVGKRFGRLLVISFDGVRDQSQNTYWKCVCDCGKEIVTKGAMLVRGDTKSCGCLYKEKSKNGMGVKHGYCRHGKVFQEYAMWNRARKRSIKKNIEFSIKIEDIVIPDKCPLLGKDLVRYSKKLNPNSPSLDRIDPKKGYTKDNIWVISTRANSAKQDLSLQELKILVENLEQKIVSQKINEDRKSHE